jgi:hypothetical protein
MNRWFLRMACAFIRLEASDKPEGTIGVFFLIASLS